MSTSPTAGGRSADRIALAGVFVELASTLAAPYVVSDLAQRLVDGCVELIDVWAAGLLLVDPGSTPKLLAASTHEAQVLELVQVRSGQGPCLAAMERDDLVVVGDVDLVQEEWPLWTQGARMLGVKQAYGIPLRTDGQTIGALNLFLKTSGPLPPEDLAVARALADVASVGIIQHRALDHATTVSTQLQSALDSRVVIEQAKGRIAEREGITVAEAFTRLRQRARSTSRPLSEMAREVVDGS
ncbi:GAF and ANTAR domain-containing protein [Actinotalea sp. K2]|uniref:GAF and ANTAR domain-containing protein n=1 Tax=Actinotalea sp. K2 TaxID=2939438 RepID=UPI002017BFA4|nr:GAF and ANTAR domain-containing protein [Actinotalea sp. K2]MCL3859996.1 GAF and ANTAR domain-containing protein [Actinotalea sp. K2]